MSKYRKLIGISPLYFDIRDVPFKYNNLFSCTNFELLRKLSKIAFSEYSCLFDERQSVDCRAASEGYVRPGYNG